MQTEWESQLDTSILEQSRDKILQVLNAGSFKDLKGLQQIGDKKAKLILGWREINGPFTKVGDGKPPGTAAVFRSDQRLTLFWAVLQLEDLAKVEGMTEKRFSSFMKVGETLSLCSSCAGLPFHHYITVTVTEEENSFVGISVDVTPRSFCSSPGKHPECHGKVIFVFRDFFIVLGPRLT